MSALTAADLATIAADVAALVAEDDRSVVFRRGNPTMTLPAQTLRLVRRNPNRRVVGQASAEERAADIVIGAAALDIAVGDRFNVDGALFRVVDVHPDRRAFTQAGVERVVEQGERCRRCSTGYEVSLTAR